MQLKTFPLARRWRAVVTLVSLGACGGGAVAQTLDSEPMPSLRASGFGTLGVMHASAPAGWGFRRDVSQAANDGGTRGDVDTRLGLQLNYAASDQVELNSQWLLTRRSPGSPAGDRLSWLFAAWRPMPDLVARIGRIPLDVFMLADYRDVGFAYVQVRPPVEFYGLLPSQMNGADVARTWQLGDAQWRARVYAGHLSGGDRANQADVKTRLGLGATVTREAGALQLRAALLSAKVAAAPYALQPVLAGLGAVAAAPVPAVASEAAQFRDRIDLAGKRVSYLALGMAYEPHPWTWKAEFSRTAGAPSFAATAGYISLERRLGDVQVFGTLSRVHPDEDARAAPQWQAALAPVLGATAAADAQTLAQYGTLAARYPIDQQTLSFGARWDVHPQAALKLQLDRVSVRPGGAGLWTRSTASPAGNARVVSMALDFVW